MENLVLVLIFFVSVIVMYFLPSWVAHARKHNNRHAIAAANLFFGWSLIGWVVTFIWSLSGNTEKRS